MPQMGMPEDAEAYIAANPDDFDGFAAGWPGFSRDAWRSKRNRLRAAGLTGSRALSTAEHEETRRAALIAMQRQADRNLGMGGGEEEEPIEIPDDEEALEELFAAYMRVGQANRAMSRPVKTRHWYAPDALPQGIAMIGDVHAGNDIEYDLFERDLRLVRDTDGLYVAYMGDLIDNFKPQAKSGTGLYHALFGNPDLQVAYVTTRTRWTQGKALVLCGGNHEGFDGRWAGIDRLPALAKDIGATYFTEAGGSIFAHVGEHRYHIVVKHDYRGKSQINKGNSARRLWDEWAWSFENADAVILAHLHEPHMEQPIRKGQKVVYLRTGSYKTHDAWAESNGYRPMYGVPLVVMYPDERSIVPFHGEDFVKGVRFLEAERARYREMQAESIAA